MKKIALQILCIMIGMLLVIPAAGAIEDEIALAADTTVTLDLVNGSITAKEENSVTTFTQGKIPMRVRLALFVRLIIRLQQRIPLRLQVVLSS